jgi:hypothetical protein
MPSASVDPARRRQLLNERLRAEFIAGAEEDSRRRLGRGLTKEELEAGPTAVSGEHVAASRCVSHGAAMHLVLSSAIAGCADGVHRRREASARDPIPNPGDRR